MIKKFLRERVEIGRHNIRLEWKWLKEFGFMSVFLIFLGVVVTGIVSLPAVFGVMSIAIGSNLPPSPTESIGLALLSAALAAVIFLLVTPRLDSTNENSSEDVVGRGRPTTRIIGIFFIVAAIAFALFAVLCPFLNAVSEGQRFFPYTPFGDFCEVVVKWTSVGSLFVGATTFVVPLTLGPFFFASDRLRKKKRM